MTGEQVGRNRAQPCVTIRSFSRWLPVPSEGDQRAWDDIVERYAPLVYAICTRYRLGSRDIEDIGQTVWLLLVEHLGKLREPAALPGWLATTTARECLRVVSGSQQVRPAGVPDGRLAAVRRRHGDR